MGKWTVDYCDDVFRAKLKGLVTGAIKRTKLEKGQATIAFEQLVDALDEGDSFTTSLIEILVKELADRETRKEGDDRRSICESTAKYLRSLAITSPIYRSHALPRLSSRRNLNLEYLAAPPPERLTLEEDGIDPEHDFIPMENDGLLPPVDFDTFFLRPQNASTSREQSRERERSPENNMTGPLPASSFAGWLSSTTETRRSPSASVFSGPSLARQGPLRRATRSRTVDFNDFTSRRRLELRHNAMDETNLAVYEGTRSESTTPTPEDIVSSEPARRSPSSRTVSAATRRLEIPLPSWRHAAATREAVWTEEPSTISGAPQTSSPRLTPLSQLLEASRALDDRARTWDEATRRRLEVTRLNAPRLRRGGVRAPESMLSSSLSLRSAHASPFSRSRSESP